MGSACVATDIKNQQVTGRPHTHCHYPQGQAVGVGVTVLFLIITLIMNQNNLKKAKKKKKTCVGLCWRSPPAFERSIFIVCVPSGKAWLVERDAAACRLAHFRGWLICGLMCWMGACLGTPGCGFWWATWAAAGVKSLSPCAQKTDRQTEKKQNKNR